MCTGGEPPLACPHSRFSNLACCRFDYISESQCSVYHVVCLADDITPLQTRLKLIHLQHAERMIQHRSCTAWAYGLAYPAGSKSSLNVGPTCISLNTHVSEPSSHTAHHSLGPVLPAEHAVVTHTHGYESTAACVGLNLAISEVLDLNQVRMGELFYTVIWQHPLTT